MVSQQAKYEAKKAKLKAIKEEWGKRLDKARRSANPLDYVIAGRGWDEAKERLDKFIKRSISHRRN